MITLWIAKDVWHCELLHERLMLYQQGEKQACSAAVMRSQTGKALSRIPNSWLRHARVGSQTELLAVVVQKHNPQGIAALPIDQRHCLEGQSQVCNFSQAHYSLPCLLNSTAMCHSTW